MTKVGKHKTRSDRVLRTNCEGWQYFHNLNTQNGGRGNMFAELESFESENVLGIRKVQQRGLAFISFLPSFYRVPDSQKEYPDRRPAEATRCDNKLFAHWRIFAGDNDDRLGPGRRVVWLLLYHDAPFYYYVVLYNTALESPHHRLGSHPPRPNWPDNLLRSRS